MLILTSFENLNLAKPFLEVLQQNGIYYELDDQITPSNPYIPEIPSVEKKLHVLVNEEDLENAQIALNEFNRKEFHSKEKEDIFKRNSQAISISLGIAIVLLVILYYQYAKTKEELAYYKGNSYVEYESGKGPCEVFVWKDSRKQAFVNCDLNHDGLYDHYKHFNRDGAKQLDGVDENQNGFYERSSLYNIYGNLSAEFRDPDDDGFENFLTLYWDTISIEYEDKNNNRIFEESEVIAKKRLK